MDRTSTPPPNQPAADVWQGLMVTVTQLAIGVERADLPQRMMSPYHRNGIAQARLALDPALARASLGPDERAYAAPTPTDAFNALPVFALAVGAYAARHRALNGPARIGPFEVPAARLVGRPTAVRAVSQR